MLLRWRRAACVTVVLALLGGCTGRPPTTPSGTTGPGAVGTCATLVHPEESLTSAYVSEVYGIQPHSTAIYAYTLRQEACDRRAYPWPEGGCFFPWGNLFSAWAVNTYGVDYTLYGTFVRPQSINEPSAEVVRVTESVLHFRSSINLARGYLLDQARDCTGSEGEDLDGALAFWTHDSTQVTVIDERVAFQIVSDVLTEELVLAALREGRTLTLP